jgi:CO dehydrogenase/acetyl-CoA synthase beta subunit
MKTRLLKFPVIIVFVSAIAFSKPGFGQESAVPPVFLYDPVFWEGSLRLTTEQKNKIDEINSEFYQELKALENSDHKDRAQLEEFLQKRGHRIYETFHQRQKKKWEKIVAAFTA